MSEVAQINRMESRNIRLLIDSWRAFGIIGYAMDENGISENYLRIFIKPYEGTLDKEIKSHTITITEYLEEDKSLQDLCEKHTKESVVGNVLDYINKNRIEIWNREPLEKEVKLSTDPYRKIK
jgi:hypothetical protein